MEDTTNQIRVLQIGMHDKIGGIETFLMNYYRNINKKGIQFDFVTMFDSICFEEEIKQLGGRVYKVTNVKKNPLKYYSQLKKIMEENKYRIVHINMLSLANIIPIIVAKRAKVENIIIHSHNTSTPHGIIRKLLDKFNKKIAVNNATELFACSELAGKWMFEKEKDFIVINNAIDLNNYKFNPSIRDKIRQELKIENKFVVGHIGRFSEQKNHKFLIEIFREVSKKEPNAILLLIGDGELKEEIKNLVNKYELNEKVIFIDSVSNANEYYQAMDIFVLPSLFEGLPVVGIEAQASGTNCIFSDTITKELELTNFVKFISIDDDSKGKWVEEIIKNKNRGKNEVCNTKLSQNYNIAREAKRMMSIYKSLIKEKSK